MEQPPGRAPDELIQRCQEAERRTRALTEQAAAIVDLARQVCQWIDSPEGSI